MNQNPDVGKSIKNKNDVLRYLILYNDDVNTFEHVIESLIQICEHTLIQAEQCAHIIHNNGKCEVKSGTYDELSPMKIALLDLGLQVTID